MPLVLQILGHETKYWMSYFDVTMVTDERSLGINAETIHYKTIEDKVGDHQSHCNISFDVHDCMWM